MNNNINGEGLSFSRKGFLRVTAMNEIFIGLKKRTANERKRAPDTPRRVETVIA